jgi:protocatechuate 3,4-dioxygenase beta subunit
MGGSIASEGKGEYMIVEGKILTTEGRPIAGAILDTWETDGHGLYDTQVYSIFYLLTQESSNIWHNTKYTSRTEPECRGRLRSTEDGSYSFRAVVCVLSSLSGPPQADPSI